MLTTALKRIGNHAANMTYRAVYEHITQAAQRAIEDASADVAQMVEDEQIAIEWQPPATVEGPTVSRDEIERLRTHDQLDQFAAAHGVTLTDGTTADKRSELTKKLC